METRSSRRWTDSPGSLWRAGSSEILPSDNSLGIPFLNPYAGAIPGRLEAFGTRRDRIASPQEVGLHFFLDDYRFERVWNNPHRGLAAVSGYGCALSPDFSLYADWPQALQVWNVYRARWIGAWWQARGVDVVPTVSWAGESSWEFCFLGLPRGSVLAVSTVGIIRNRDAREAFVAGFEAMARQLAPALVLAYGRPVPEVEDLAEIRYYPTRWDKTSSVEDIGQPMGVDFHRV